MNTRKQSSHCDSGTCVKVYGPWKKSRHSNGSGSCLETSTDGDTIRVRDSKYRGDPEAQPTLSFTRDEWAAFIAGAKDGEFDL